MSDKTNGDQHEYSEEKLDCYIIIFMLLYTNDAILFSESPEDLQYRIICMSIVSNGSFI